MNDQIAIYQTSDGQTHIDVWFQDETVWLSQAQMAVLFQVKPQNISMHLKNIFSEQELSESATCKDFLQVQQEGGRDVRRQRKHYSLDAVISVGYRVNSSRATQFRIWATQTLKQHLLEVYSFNQKRLQQRGVEFEQVLQLLSATLSNQAALNEQGAAVLAVINDYARGWSLLQSYDEQSLADNTYRQADMQPLVLDDVLLAIAALKKELVAKGEASALFAQLRGEGLASSIATF